MARKYRDEEWLRKKYTEERLTQQEIADICGVSRTTIGKWARKYDISRFQPPYYGTDVKGYVQIQNRVDGTLCCVKVHRLLAVAEYGIQAVKGMDVHHQNDIPWDNRADNITLEQHDEHGHKSAHKRWK